MESFDAEVFEIFAALGGIDGDPRITDRTLRAEHMSTVRIRWGPERYAAMRNAESVETARRNRQRANGGTDGRSYSPAESLPDVNENERPVCAAGGPR